MAQWHRNIQDIITIIDDCIRAQHDEALTLRALAQKLGYSEYYTSRKFRELAGMTLRDYLRLRRLAFALRDVRDTDASILDIAVKYGFSSNEAFTHAFKKAYGVSPSAYRTAPGPVVLRTILRPFDCYLTEGAGSLSETQSAGEVQTYFVHIPAHKFLHIRNYESIGYRDFWQRQSAIPGQDCETICGLLASIPGKLDDAGGKNNDAGSGQLMAWINEPTGRICSWGIPLAEAYGVRLPADYAGPVPAQMQLMDVPGGEYLVFEHGPFDFETQSAAVEAKIEQAMRDFDYAASGYRLDLTPGRVFYFYHDCARFSNTCARCAGTKHHKKQGRSLRSVPVFCFWRLRVPGLRLLAQPVGPRLDALALERGDREHLNVRVELLDALDALFEAEVEVRRNVDLVDEQHVADREHERVLQGLVVALRHGEDHCVFHGAGVKLRRADEVADIFEDGKVDVLRAEPLETLTRHARVEMAHTAGMQLDDLCAAGGDGRRIDVRVDVGLHDTDAQIVLQGVNGRHEGRGLAAAGRGHEVEQEGVILLELFAQQVGLPVVVFKNALFNLEHAE